MSCMFNISNACVRVRKLRLVDVRVEQVLGVRGLEVFGLSKCKMVLACIDVTVTQTFEHLLPRQVQFQQQYNLVYA